MSEFNEPWTSLRTLDEVGHHIVDATSREVADDGSAGDEYSQTMTKETAERIVACVNACRGIPTALLQECDSPRKLLDEVAFWNANADLDAAADQPAATSAG